MKVEDSSPFMVLFMMLTVLIIFFSLLFSPMNKSPEFTITKEECRIEQSCVYECGRTDETSGGGKLIVGVGCDFRAVIDDYTGQYCSRAYIEKEVCEDVEVEFMLLPYIDNCIGMDCPKEDEDLSIKWLDENCKLIASIPNSKLYLCGGYKVEVLE